MPEYQRALEKSGHTFQLKYDPTTTTTTTSNNNNNNNNNNKRSRTRNITWFNPPFDLGVQTNIGKEFFKAVDESFPVGHELRPICNRNTLKLSYSCMPNIKSTIDSHNKRKLNTKPVEEAQPCNCRIKDNCPLNGQCRTKNIVYQATITAHNKKPETYIGLASTEFKTRFNNHTSSFTKSYKRNQTELSKYIWQLKENSTSYQIKWSIVGRARPYCNTTKRCNLCLLEKYYILCHRDKSSLNKRNELASYCRHRTNFLLSSIT